MAVIIGETAETGGGIDVIVNSTSGSGSDTGVVVGIYGGAAATMVNEQQQVEKVGPLFVTYDPELANLLAMNF